MDDDREEYRDPIPTPAKLAAWVAAQLDGKLPDQELVAAHPDPVRWAHAPTPQPDAERVQGEVTAAVRRAAEAIRTSVIDTPTEKAAPIMARAGLDAALDVEEIARVDAETSRCSWSIPQDGHPYHEACLYKRERVDGGESHGACWDMPYARATALRAAILGGAA